MYTSLCVYIHTYILYIYKIYIILIFRKTLSNELYYLILQVKTLRASGLSRVTLRMLELAFETKSVYFQVHAFSFLYFFSNRFCDHRLIPRLLINCS